MWTYERSAETEADPGTLFALFSDVDSWPTWNAGVQRMELDGPFCPGTTGRMTLTDQETLTSRLTWVEEDVVSRTRPRFPAQESLCVCVTCWRRWSTRGTRITYRCVIEGPSAEEIGPMVTADFPDVIAALSARALEITQGFTGSVPGNRGGA